MAEHGTRSRYSSGCRCAECRRANCEYEKRRVRRRAHEKLGYPAAMVDAAPVRERLLRLYASGYSEKEVVRLTGLARSTLRSITKRHHRSGRPVQRVRRETKDAIFSIRNRRALKPAQLVDAEWFSEWADEYARRGLTIREMESITGIDYQVLRRLTNERPGKIEGKTAYAFLAAKPALDRAAAEKREEGE